MDSHSATLVRTKKTGFPDSGRQLPAPVPTPHEIGPDPISKSFAISLHHLANPVETSRLTISREKPTQSLFTHNPFFLTQRILQGLHENCRGQFPNREIDPNAARTGRRKKTSNPRTVPSHFWPPRILKAIDHSAPATEDEKHVDPAILIINYKATSIPLDGGLNSVGHRHTLLQADTKDSRLEFPEEGQKKSKG